MRNIKFILKFVLACVLGLVLQLTLHEMGHALFAVITGNEVVDITIGIISYAEISVTNAWSVPLISIGSFILPIIVCVVIEFIPSIFTKMLNTVILVITTIQLGINSVAICFEQNYDVLQTYDLGILVTACNVNAIVVSAVTSLITIALTIWSVSKLIKIANEF